jgi:hypothetical protein
VKRDTSTTRISRDVEPEHIADLALAPPRAAMAANINGTIHLLPATVTLADPSDPRSSTRLVHLPADAPDLTGRDIVLVTDDGPQWFLLRALIIRGLAVPAGNQRYHVEPRRVVAWDYGSVREVPAGAPSPPPATVPVTPSANPAPLPMSSAAMAAQLRATRVMVLATRSAKGWCSPCRCGSWSTATGSTPRPVRRHGPCATLMLAQRWPCYSVVNVVPAEGGC